MLWSNITWFLSCSLSQVLLSHSANFILVLVSVISLQLRMNSWGNLFNFITFLLKHFLSIPLLIKGDMNTQIGPHNQNLVSSLGFEVIYSLPPPLADAHTSKDMLFNMDGLQLMEFCIVYNLNILNGSINFPNTSKFTYSSIRGSSVIDYHFCSPDLCPMISSFLLECILRVTIHFFSWFSNAILL